jgi:DNA-binding NarL/FixJ family response regulator
VSTAERSRIAHSAAGRETRRQPARKILVVHDQDHPIVRNRLKQVLAREEGLAVVAEAGSAEEALLLARRGDWDLVLLAISLSGRSGLELLMDLRRTKPSLPVLVLQIQTEDGVAVRAIRAGAAGCLRKNCTAADLLAAIRTIVSGRRSIAPSADEKPATEIGRQSSRAPHDLSEREREVVKLIAAGRSTAQIAAALSIGQSTVSTYRQRALAKLNLRTNAEITRYAVGAGLVTRVAG